MRIEEALERYELQLRADGRSDHTAGQYKRHVTLLARWAAQVGLSGDIGDLDHEDVARFLVSAEAATRPDGRPKRATSMNALRSSLRTFFGYLHAVGLLRTNPAALVRRARCGTAPPRGLSEDEQRRLLDALSKGEGRAAERDHALFHLLLATGIRIGSALALEVRDVDLERGELELRSMKNDRPDRVFLGPRIVEHLSRYIGDRDAGWLFQGQGRAALTARQAQRRLAMWCELAGIRVASCHALRHTFGMAVYRRTGDIFVVKEALRHRSVTSTLVYAQVSQERVREAVGA